MDVLDGHTEGRRGGHRQFCLPKFAHVRLSRASEVHRRSFWIFPIFKFENRSRTTCPRFLQSFASRPFFSKHNERCERQYRHKPQLAFVLLRQGSPSFKSRHSLSYSNHFQHHGIYTYTCTYNHTYAYTYTNTYSKTFTYLFF